MGCCGQQQSNQVTLQEVQQMIKRTKYELMNLENEKNQIKQHLEFEQFGQQDFQTEFEIEKLKKQLKKFQQEQIRLETKLKSEEETLENFYKNFDKNKNLQSNLKLQDGQSDLKKICIYSDGDISNFQSNQYLHDCDKKNKIIYLTKDGYFQCEGGCQQFQIIEAQFNTKKRTISKTSIRGQNYITKIDSSQKLMTIAKQSLEQERGNQNFLNLLFQSQAVFKLEEMT